MHPTQAGFTSAPAGVVLDTPEQIHALAAQIKAVAVDSTFMPLGNATKMTDDGAHRPRAVDRRRCEHEVDPGVLKISVAGYELTARLEEELSPRTVAFFRTMLPYDSKLIQARWSGQAAWIPMGAFDVGDLGPEDPTSYPAPGELLLYPGGVSEVEILFPYGDTCFASKAGQLAGNHFATVVGGIEHLQAIGELVLWGGAQDITFSETA